VGHCKSTFRRALTGGGLAVAIAVSATTGVAIGARNQPPPIIASTPAERRALNLKVFDAVWNRVDREYYDQSFGGRDWDAERNRYRERAAASSDPAALYYEVLTPMLNGLGSSHLGVAPPRNGPIFLPRKSSRPRVMAFSRGNGPGDVFERLGLVFAAVDGRQIVVDVRNHSPAERAGIAPGWRLLRVHTAAPQTKAVFLLAPPVGPPVEILLVNDGGAPPRPPYERQRSPNGAIVLRFDDFERATIDWVLDQVKSAPPFGVILDLRGNSGGPVRQNRRLMAAILRPGSPTQIQQDSDGFHTLRTPGHAWAYEGPVAILIGPRSASSAEVVASAVRLNRRGPVVGSRTAGALLTSRRWRLPDGGRLTVAIEDFRAPDGRRIENVGVAPTLSAVQTLAAIRQDRDLVIEAADRALTRPR
jgi:carboxyl-terminal processing protease